MAKRYSNILETIGRTPVVRINKLAPEGVNLYAKIEAFNPGGSVKDRLALGIIEAAERDGTLAPGQTVIEATSGNTGIGLAVVCAHKGYPLVVTMAESFSVERRKLMRFFGAKVVLTPAAEKGSGMLAKAIELAEKHGWFLCRQFENEANADMHSRTTAVEILDDFDGERLDYWVTGYGTGGTLKGVARVLKKERPETKIIVCEPDNSPLIGSGIAQQRAEGGGPSASHPSFRPHLMQGWTPDFISKLTEEAITSAYVDQVLSIRGGDALHYSQALARQEGIFVGITAGATLAGAIAVSRSAAPGSNVLCMLPDTGERYLSTPLFNDISVDMSEEEIEISTSTPGYRFDAPPPAKPSEGTAPAPQVSVDAAAFVEQAIHDKAQPVVLFALEWCEFCWSIRKLFGQHYIDYRSIDLDSAELQKDNWGGQIRAALTAKTGMQTIPQVFVAGEFLGGCTEVFDAYKEGRLQQLMQDNDILYDTSVDIDPYALLPQWLQPR